MEAGLLGALVEKLAKHLSLIGHDGLRLLGKLGIGRYLGQEFANGFDDQTVRTRLSDTSHKIYFSGQIGWEANRSLFQHVINLPRTYAL